MAAKLGDIVYYFPDYQSGNPVPMTALVVEKQGSNISLFLPPHINGIGAQVFDVSTGFVQEGTNLQDCLNPGNKWIDRATAEAWGVI